MRAHCEHLNLAGWLPGLAQNRPLNRTSDYPPGHPPDLLRPRLKAPSNRLPNPSPDCSLEPASQTSSPSQNAAAILPKMQIELEVFLRKVEFEFGHNVARPLAKKRPEPPAPETPPCKESLHIWINQARNMGRFLDIGLATLWPNF